MTTESTYLDHCATTPLREEALEAMMPYLREHHGNAGSIHAPGRQARRAVDDAREQVAALINAEPQEICFTSGGTEADNLALWSAVMTSPKPRKRVLVSAVEHHAVLHCAEHLQKHFGVEMVTVPVDADGRVDPAELDALLDDAVVLVSVMHANNETGVIQPIGEIAGICAARGVLFHTDTVQSAGKIPLDLQTVPAAFAALSAHKLYGPKGIGACFVRKDVEVTPMQTGGAQERRRRAGTENVAGIVGFGKACELALRERESEHARLTGLRQRFEDATAGRFDATWVNSGGAARLPHVSNIGFGQIDGESLLLALDFEGIAVSTGSACTAGSTDPSHVLLAMGQPYDEAQSAIRFSMGRSTTEADVDRAAEVVLRAVRRLRTVAAFGA